MRISAGTPPDLAGEESGVGHIRYVPITGVDRVPLGYFRDKLVTENVIKADGVPYTIVRAVHRAGGLPTKAEDTGTRTWEDYLA